MTTDTAAGRAKALLHGAARQLHTVDPVDLLGEVLEESLPGPPGSGVHSGRRALEPRFSELGAGPLAFDLLPGGPTATPRERIDRATGTMRQLTGQSFGRQALRWLDGRMEVAPALGSYSATWGASMGSGFGPDGVRESAVYMEWGPQLMESLPAPLHRVVRVVLESLPGVRPSFSTIRCTPRAGTQQVTFDVPHALPLERLRGVMTRLGLGHQHTSLISACALLLGSRYVLPPDAGMLTVRLTRSGVELRLDVDLAGIPDPPPQIARLIGLHLTERPRSLRAFRMWVAAMTPEGYESPGRLSVLSVSVRPDMPARLSLHLCPAAIERPPAYRRHREVEDEDEGVPRSVWAPSGWQS
jgi:hypothetical protein